MSTRLIEGAELVLRLVRAIHASSAHTCRIRNIYVSALQIIEVTNVTAMIDMLDNLRHQYEAEAPCLVCNAPEDGSLERAASMLLESVEMAAAVLSGHTCTKRDTFENICAQFTDVRGNIADIITAMGETMLQSRQAPFDMRCRSCASQVNMPAQQ